MRRILIIICLLFFASSAMAATDIIATYKYQDGRMVTIVTRDNNHVRMDTSPNRYMLLKKDKVYAVSKDDNGRWRVMDMGQMMAMTSGGFKSLFGGGKAKTKKSYSATYEKTGQKEKIAGYTGLVYNVDVMENGNLVRRDEVVLSSHSDIKKVSDAFAAIASKMSKNMGQNMEKSFEIASKEAKKAGYGGLLRYGDEMKLFSLKKRFLNISYYQIPKGAQKVEMGKMPVIQPPPATAQPQKYDLPEQSSDQVSTGDKPQSQAGKALEQDAKDVGQTARQETKDATMEEVKEGVRNLFKSIFK